MGLFFDEQIARYQARLIPNFSLSIQAGNYLRIAILYDFSGHKPDLEGKIQICFRYGFDRPVLSVLWFMIDEFRNHINRWRYYAIHLVEQKGTLIDMFVIFLKYNF